MDIPNNVNYVIVEISGRQFWMEPSRWYDVNRIPIEVHLFSPLALPNRVPPQPTQPV